MHTSTQNDSGKVVTKSRVCLPLAKRRQRIQDTIKALAFLRGGAKLTPYLTDTKPKFVIAAVLSCSNHIFMELVREVNENAFFDTEAFKEVIRNFGDRIISPLYVGWDIGFLAEQRTSFCKDFTNTDSGKTLRITTNSVTNRRQINFADGQRPAGAIDIQINFGSVRDVLEEASQFISTTILPEPPQERH